MRQTSSTSSMQILRIGLAESIGLFGNTKSLVLQSTKKSALLAIFTIVYYFSHSTKTDNHAKKNLFYTNTMFMGH